VPQRRAGVDEQRDAGVGAHRVHGAQLLDGADLHVAVLDADQPRTRDGGGQRVEVDVPVPVDRDAAHLRAAPGRGVVHRGVLDRRHHHRSGGLGAGGADAEHRSPYRRAVVGRQGDVVGADAEQLRQRGPRGLEELAGTGGRAVEPALVRPAVGAAACHAWTAAGSGGAAEAASISLRRAACPGTVPGVAPRAGSGVRPGASAGLMTSR
jgi:hypothetical protein